LRGAIDAPAITISGCTTSHPAVAKMMARMRLLDGVQRVTLTGSEKAEMGGGATGDSAAGGGDCRAGSDQYPKFDLIVFFKPIAGQGTPAAAPAATSPATPTTSGAAQ
ncbi:MAG TPA: hypothetical protein VNT22_11495, partial [Baekduia sp.]|nr:hypothetical protein [Baekduia sp.]